METLIGRKFDPYSDDDPWVYANRERLYEAVKDETAVEPNGWMLDAGCGDGSFSSHLRNCLGTIVGIDLSILALRSSRTVSPRLCVVRCHSGYLPFRDASFSRVLSKDMLHHIRDPSRGTEELSRVLEPASSLIITRTRSLPCGMLRAWSSW